MNRSKYPLLSQIEAPADLRKLDKSQLKPLSAELRNYLIESVSKSGGHFGANLGTVELTIALHHVLNTPYDRLVWDVGHQSYPHKILTGRRDQLGTIRKHGGLTPFPKRKESEYDNFGVGHSSTSISAALGMAMAARINGERRKSVAVIGDGAMTAGMAFEALNNAGDLAADLLVILNDNEMSISPNVGALNKYFTKLLSGRFYSTVRESGKRALTPMPQLKELARRTEEHVKGMLTPGTLFEAFGFQYFGPVDGHDIDSLREVIANVSDIRGPCLLHVVTKKGKGYERAEEDQVKYHGVGQFDPEEGIVPAGKPSGPTYTQVFGQWLCDMAAEDNKLAGITPAMREGSGLVEFEKQYPDRYFDVGIAEQHAVTLAAGMACDGVKPVVAIYSTFLQRAYDQTVHDVDIQNLDVLYAIDRAGLVGPDGPTHAGSFDYTFLRCLPNTLVMAPADENECRKMLSTGYQHKGPAAVRYPRGKGPGVEVEPTLDTLPIGKAEVRRKGSGIALLGFGAVLADCGEVAENLGASLVNMRFIRPLDGDTVLAMAETHDLLITVEENAVAGGAGSAVNEYLSAAGVRTPVLNIGLPDRYIEHGQREEMLADAGLDAAGIEKQIRDWLQQNCDISQKSLIS
ncbi:MAG: 1-deoxy-D-xylulose-5-phosphate synthase [Pseudomonadota bacterium]